jgi:hypothetical protein
LLSEVGLFSIVRFRILCEQRPHYLMVIPEQLNDFRKGTEQSFEHWGASTLASLVAPSYAALKCPSLAEILANVSSIWGMR